MKRTEDDEMIHEKIRCFLSCFLKSEWDNMDLNRGGKLINYMLMYLINLFENVLVIKSLSNKLAKHL